MSSGILQVYLFVMKNVLATAAFVSICVAGFFAISEYQKRTADQTEIQVALSDVRSSAVVSGKVLAQNSATLTFPSVGVVKAVYKTEGEYVKEGEVLASLTQDVLVNQYEAALQAVNYQKALQAELLRGPLNESKKVSDTTVVVAEKTLDKIEAEYDVAVAAAKEALLSTDLAAFTTDNDDPAVPPVVTGTYTCDSEGEYILDLYPSNSRTGFSFRYSGLESGFLTAWTKTAIAIGTCGLYVQFDEGSDYQKGTWVIEIPNKRSPYYLQNRNAYELSLAEREGALAVAASNVNLAEDARIRDTRLPSPETKLQSEARVAEATSVLASIAAQIDHMVIKAPFSGQVTDVNIKVGETSDPSKVITLLSEEQYELEVYIPEANIRQAQINNRVEVVFDASPNEVLLGSVSYISPQSMQVEGVSYYMAKINLQNTPQWLREGLSADVEIVFKEVAKVPAVPRQYLLEEDGAYFVYLKEGTSVVRRNVTVGMVGTNGLVEVGNIPVGSVLIRP